MPPIPPTTSSESRNYDKLMKVILLGDSGVGKSCLMQRFCNGMWQPSWITTIGIDFLTRTIELDGKRIKFQVMDTAGQERFRVINESFAYRNTRGILLVYDVCNAESFERIRTWWHTIERRAIQGVTVILVGNKVEDEEQREISTDQGQEIADELGIRFFETSAKANQGVTDVFVQLARDFMVSEEAYEDRSSIRQEVKLEPRPIDTSTQGGCNC